MIRLARSFGAEISSADGEVLGKLASGRAGWAELSFELVDDRLALIAAVSDTFWALAVAHPWHGFGRLRDAANGSALAG